MRLVTDTETNGLLDRPDLKLLCTVLQDVDTGATERFHGHGHPDAFKDSQRLRARLSQATLLIGHNIAGFDIHVFERHFGEDWTWDFDLFDTRAISRLRYVETLERMTYAFRRGATKLSNAAQEERFWRGGAIPGRDAIEAAEEARFPKSLLAKNKTHSLAAWGYRLKLQKGDYLAEAGVQEAWGQPLEDYCEQDVVVTRALFQRLLKADSDGRQAPPMATCIDESLYCYLLQLQELHGVGFDSEKAGRLYASLCGRRDDLAAQLKQAIVPWYRPAILKGDPLPADLVPFARGSAPVKVPKVTYKVPYPSPLAGRSSGCAYTPVELVEFNPASRPMIADRLMKLHGWKPDPEKKTPAGEVQVDESVLGDLEYPCIPLLVEYLTTEKVLGQLSEGQKSWMKAVKPDGRIHASVLSTGARTTRCSHSRPNLAQVPSVRVHPETKQPLEGYAGHFGAECRDLFVPTRPELVLVGCDASGLELRMLAHRLGFYDGGAFATLLLTGDPHSAWQKACGIFFRNNQKTLTYAFLYGAGTKKLGMIVLDDWRMAFDAGLTAERPPARSHAPRLGLLAKERLLKNVPGLQQLLEACAGAHARGFVKLIDGTTVVCKSEHGVLNDVLQGDGARAMKKAKVLLSRKLKAVGWKHGWQFSWLLDIHDEWQMESRAPLAQPLGQMAAESIKDAGVALGLRIALAGEFKVGKSWKETH